MSSNRKFYVAGVQHHELHKVLAELSEGDELDLIPEPDNKFDPNAIKIMCSGVMCGYVPRKFSAEVTAIIETGTDLICEITHLNASAKPWEQCEVTIREIGEEVEEVDIEELLDEAFDYKE
jgi:hypothetical protein